jgi:sigma-B regulation protein RsbU (phosphoserine phosphatase)
MANDQASLLVVDDDEMNRDMLARRLQHKGYAVTIAKSGREALELLGDQPFDLVLLDVTMPGLSGLEVLRTVRRIEMLTDLPIIMATARGESGDIVEALNLGANDYVTKPLDFPVVLARIRTQLALKRAVEQIKGLQQSLTDHNKELELANTKLGAANGRMKADLEAAARVQQTLLPGNPPAVPGVSFAWFFRPCEELAGDLFNALRLDGRHVGLYVFDVSGHGVSAALLSVTVSWVLARMPGAAALLTRPGDNGIGEVVVPPAQVARELTGRFPFDPATEQYFTLLYGILDQETREFRFVSAGHPAPVYMGHGRPPVVLQASGLPIGIATKDYSYEEHSIRLMAGDRLFLYTDGLVETMDPEGQLYGTERLLHELQQTRSLPLAESLAALRKHVEAWAGSVRLRDDISVLALEIADQAP